MLENKISTVIFEEDNGQLNQLLQILSKQNEIEVSATTSSCVKLKDLISNTIPHLLILDVKTNDFCAFHLLRSLKNKNILPEIVFLANNESLAYDSMEFQPLDFILKPIQENEVLEMTNRLKLKLKKKELIRKMDIYEKLSTGSNKKVFKQKNGIILLHPEEIVFCKANLSNTILNLANSKKEKCSTGMKETFEIINSDDFVKINRSYFINLRFLRKIDKKRRKCILASNGKTWEVPASKNITDRLEKLNTFLIY